jgi:activating signal cointegrator 1
LVEMPRGCILGTVVLSECVPAQAAENHNNLGDFSPGRFAWRASEPQLLPTPIPFRGMQGFFNVPSELLAEVAR